MGCCGDHDVLKEHSIEAVLSLTMVGNPCLVEGAEKPVATSVARKHLARPVGSVRRRSQANDEMFSRGIAEEGNWLSPIHLIFISAFFSYCHEFTPGNEARALLASYDS